MKTSTKAIQTWAAEVIIVTRMEANTSAPDQEKAAATKKGLSNEKL